MTTPLPKRCEHANDSRRPNDSGRLVSSVVRVPSGREASKCPHRLLVDFVVEGEVSKCRHRLEEASCTTTPQDVSTRLPGEPVTWIDRADPFHPVRRSGTIYSLRRHGGYWFAIVESDDGRMANDFDRSRDLVDDETSAVKHRLVVVALGLLERVEEPTP